MNPSILFLFFLINSIICERVNYVNPIIRKDVPDPTIIKGDNGYYYLYATGEGIYRSYDLVRWEYVRQVFEGKPRPSFIDVSSYWAPCITKQGNLYVLYFALSVWDGIDTAGIGVATASTPEELKAWLASEYANGTPVILVYPLATPTTETVTAQPMNIQAGTNIVQITQASMDDLELEVKYKAGVSVTITEIENAQLDDNVEVTIQ